MHGGNISHGKNMTRRPKSAFLFADTERLRHFNSLSHGTNGCLYLPSAFHSESRIEFPEREGKVVVVYRGIYYFYLYVLS